MTFKTKYQEPSFFAFFWISAGVGAFWYGILLHDWYFLVGGFLWELQDIHIIHWNGKEYKKDPLDL